MTPGPLVPAAADPLPATGNPVPPVLGDPDAAEPESLMGKADSLAAPDTAGPASAGSFPAGSPVSVPAQAASPELLTGLPTGPAGFFIGPLQPETADSGDAEPLAAQDGTAEPGAASP